MPDSLTAARNPAWAKNPKKPEEKATPIRGRVTENEDPVFIVKNEAQGVRRKAKKYGVRSVELEV